MKTKLIMALGMSFMFATPTIAEVTADPNQTLLPEAYTVYTDGTTVINHAAPGYNEKVLPTINLYKGAQGCYIACYSRQQENAVYSVGNNIYVLGQVRVAGKYNGRICEPTNYAGKDISADVTFKTICTEKVTTCANAQCWAGGDTGGWFGIQPVEAAPFSPQN
jgi:hypothetical protein